MTNVTLALPDDLHEKMKQFSEIRWSEVVRKTIAQKIEELEMMDKLTKKSKLSQKDVDEIASRMDTNVAKQLGLI
jgi:hypothetical protein